MRQKWNLIRFFLLAILLSSILPPTPEAAEPSNVPVEPANKWNIPQALIEFDEQKYAEDLTSFHNSASTGEATSTWSLLEQNEAEAHLHLGIYFFTQGQKKLAEDQFKKTLKLDPDHALAHFNLGLVYNEQKKLDSAKTEYSEAIRLNPALHRAHSNLGTLNLLRKEYQAATKNFKTAIGLKPEDLKSHISLGHLYFYVFKNFPEAKKEYKEVLKLDPKFKLAQANLKTIYKDENTARTLEHQFENSLKAPAREDAAMEVEVPEETSKKSAKEKTPPKKKKDLFHF